MWKPRMPEAGMVQSAISGGPGGPTAPSSLSTLSGRLRSALKQIVGMPDYARYLAHAREHHPGCRLLSEREHYDQFVAQRYGGGATRCC
jgi:uncharacterized short protein YbdD (DUF466 family)